MNNHPNATASGLSSAVGMLTIAALGAAGVTLSPPVAAAIVGVVSTLVLLVGRSGVEGLARQLWRGEE